MRPARALRPEDRCIAYTKQQEQCLLEHRGNRLCSVHTDYPAKLLARISDPRFFKGKTPKYEPQLYAELESAIKNDLLVVHGLLATIPPETGFGPFYNWYLGFHQGIDPWAHVRLAWTTIHEAIQLYLQMLDTVPTAKVSVCNELEGLMQALKTDRAVARFFRIVLFKLGPLHRDRRTNEHILEQFIETGVADTMLWGSFDLSKWLDGLEEDYARKSAETLSQLKGLTRYLFLPKLKERKLYIRSIAQSRTYSYKEELMAKAYHPTRYIVWCLDEDEKAEIFTDFGLTAEEQQHESTASWSEYSTMIKLNTPMLHA